MPDIEYEDNPLFMKSSAQLGDIHISYWQGIPCDVCGDELTHPAVCTKLERGEKIVYACTTCSKSVIKRWSK